MKTDLDYLAAFESAGYPNNEMIQFSPSAARESLPMDVAHYLETIGFPDFATPHLFFGEFEDGQTLPTLYDWNWRKYEAPPGLENFVVLGLDDREDPICIEIDSGEVVTFQQAEGYKRSFMNSSVWKCAEVLIAFGRFMDMAIEIDPSYDFESRVYPVSLVDLFSTQLRNIDDRAYERGTFWRRRLDLLYERTKT